FRILHRRVDRHDLDDLLRVDTVGEGGVVVPQALEVGHHEALGGVLAICDEDGAGQGDGHLKVGREFGGVDPAVDDALSFTGGDQRFDVHGHVHTAIRQGRGDLAEIADDDPLDFLFSQTSGAEGQLSEDVVDAAFAGDRDAAAAHVLERLDLVDHPGAADEVEVRSTGNVSSLIGD